MISYDNGIGCSGTSDQFTCPCCGQSVWNDSDNSFYISADPTPEKEELNYKEMFREWLRHLYPFKFKEVLMLRSTSILPKLYFRKILFSNSGHIPERLRNRFKNK